MKILNPLLLSLFTAGCGSVTIAGVVLDRDDYPRHERGLVRECAKDSASVACHTLATSTRVHHTTKECRRRFLSDVVNGISCEESGRLVTLQTAMFKWMLDHHNLGQHWSPRAVLEILPRYRAFDTRFIVDQVSPYCVWGGPPAEIGAPPPGGGFGGTSSAGDVSCEEFHQFLLDNGDPGYAYSFAEINCERLKNTYGCHLYLDKYPDEFHKFAEEQCNGEMYGPACDEYDLLDPVGAPHQRWTERDREAVREAAREWEAEERRWEAEQREIERQELEEEAEYERRRQERQDAVMDAIEETPQIIQEEMERNQRDLDEQIRRQNELFKDPD